MELLICALAALAAGVGTGLAGLSAATVMVPVMIVLCPSFAGETGAYHATAIALASDILGSAFTSAIYIRHRNIDLKRGGIMLACIVSMCIAGSIAAWHAGNVVLGTFSLFLCVGIGIRFLLKPDTQKDKPVKKGAKLDWKGIAISLFFGLTIGFGTGFVGSGGGMMMLVVFTAFLGMERKSAVGTSTLIMTFTALIAFVSHALVDPTLVLEKWQILLLCIVVETAASIVSAQFANRVNNRVVGLVTGGVLTVLGVVMLGIHYRETMQEFYKSLPNFRFVTGASRYAVGDGWVEYTDREGAVCRIECDSVVALGGMSPLQTEAMALYGCAGEFYMIGDCRQVGNIHTGSRDAYAVTHQF